MKSLAILSAAVALMIACVLALQAGEKAAAPPAAGPATHLVDVFVAGTDGYHTYRIPSLIVTPKGTLLAFCEGRKTGRGDAGNIDVVLRRSFDGGRCCPAPQFQRRQHLAAHAGGLGRRAEHRRQPLPRR
ncbi:MAG: sialidase family protein [Planctomycetota bacterium]|nr:sialidase family protein [Planctomycetota bacterium]